MPDPKLLGAALSFPCVLRLEAINFANDNEAKITNGLRYDPGGGCLSSASAEPKAGHPIFDHVSRHDAGGSPRRKTNFRAALGVSTSSDHSCAEQAYEFEHRISPENVRAGYSISEILGSFRFEINGADDKIRTCPPEGIST
ncbi:hypothetical protein G0D83_18315 [Yangia sp. PrR003]|nr:hypothetical protein [Salipiger sp. PrR003]